MKHSVLSAVALSALVGSATTGFAQSGLTLNFGPLVGSTIVFGGSADTFNFTPTTAGTTSADNNLPGGAQWCITSESGSSALGLDGAFGNGPFYYSTPTPGGVVQTATVTGPSGELYIQDSLGGVLQGSVNFIDISTYQYSGGINAALMINLTDVIYTGSNPDLDFLTANQPGSVNLTFQFNPGMTLSQLSMGAGGYSSSYSGSIYAAAVPEPSSLLMSGLGAVGALVLTLGRRITC